MSYIIKEARNLLQDKFWSEMFLVTSSEVEKILAYRGDLVQKGEGKGTSSNPSPYVTAGTSKINSPTNKADIFTPTHDMPELDAKMSIWHSIGGKEETLNKYKQLLWLLTLKNAWIKHKVPFPNGLTLTMVAKKIAEIRRLYAKDFEKLNFASYDLQKQVRIAQDVPPGQITLNKTYDTHHHYHYDQTDPFRGEDYLLPQLYGDEGDDEITFKLPSEVTPLQVGEYGHGPQYRKLSLPLLHQKGQGKRKRAPQTEKGGKKKKWYHFIPLFDTDKAWTQVI